jgi:hypothetical protein
MTQGSEDIILHKCRPERSTLCSLILLFALCGICGIKTPCWEEDLCYSKKSEVCFSLTQTERCLLLTPRKRINKQDNPESTAEVLLDVRTPTCRNSPRISQCGFSKLVEPKTQTSGMKVSLFMSFQHLPPRTPHFCPASSRHSKHVLYLWPWPWASGQGTSQPLWSAIMGSAVVTWAVL